MERHGKDWEGEARKRNGKDRNGQEWNGKEQQRKGMEKKGRGKARPDMTCRFSMRIRQ